MPIRPCFLVIDQEHASSISTRKLVLETAKYNVITAYSCREGIDLLRVFPRLSAVVMNGSTSDQHAGQLLEVLNDMPEIKLVVVGEGPMTQGARHPDTVIEGFAPSKLLEGLKDLFPSESRQLLEHEDELEKKQI